MFISVSFVLALMEGGCHRRL